jgi:hypothetical protein
MGTAREELAGGDVGNISTLGTTATTQSRPVHNGDATETTDDYQGVTLTLLNGRSAKMEASVTQSSKIRVIGGTQEFKASTRDIVVVYNGTDNPVVYKRHETQGADQVTHFTVFVNDVIVYQSK